MSSRFLKRGQMVVYTRGRIPNSAEDYRAEAQGDTTDVPLVVMVNRNSASASEIVSGAMQDHDRAIVVGETTFGKALVQGVYRISQNAGLALTTGRYYTPSGRMIQRPWDGAFDEYLTTPPATRKRRESIPRVTEVHVERPEGLQRRRHRAGSLHPGPGRGLQPVPFLAHVVPARRIRVFAERFTKEGDQRPAARSAAVHKVAPGWQVTDAMVAEFKQFVASERVRIDEAAFAADVAFIKAMIRFEVDNDLFGIEEARRNLSRVDPQAQSALSFFDEARQLIVAKR